MDEFYTSTPFPTTASLQPPYYDLFPDAQHSINNSLASQLMKQMNQSSDPPFLHHHHHNATKGNSTTSTVINSNVYNNNNSNNNNWTSSLTNNGTLDGADDTDVHDKTYNETIRISIMYVQIVIGIIGAMLLVIYMINTRKVAPRLSRVNALILNLCVADLMVICFSSVTQVVWEHMSRRWIAGDIMCRLIKMLQIFGICASVNMLVVIAVDRHQAITAPLRKQFSIWLIVSIGWGVALLSSIPLLFVFHVRYDPEKNMTVCQNTFRGKERIHRQAFLTYATLVNFVFPLIILCVCYVRIFLKIARKASECRKTRREPFKQGKIHLTSNTTSNTLHNAKLKTLKMTVVIVLCFIVCGMPYFVVEMYMSYGDHTHISPDLYGILGGIAVANSAVNPFIVLHFSVNYQCLRNFKLCPARTGPNNRQLMYKYKGSIRSRENSSALFSRTPMTMDSSEMTTSVTCPMNKNKRSPRLH